MYSASAAVHGPRRICSACFRVRKASRTISGVEWLAKALAANPPLAVQGVKDVLETFKEMWNEGLVPKSALNPDQIVGIDAIMAEAVATKFMAAPLTPEQIAELVRMPLPPR